MSITKWHEDLLWPVNLDKDLFWDIDQDGENSPVWMSYDKYLELKSMEPEDAYKVWVDCGGKLI